MAKLPEMNGGMPLDQAMLLELYKCLVDAGIITEEKAIEIYFDRQTKFANASTWTIFNHNNI